MKVVEVVFGDNNDELTLNNLCCICMVATNKPDNHLGIGGQFSGCPPPRHSFIASGHCPNINIPRTDYFDDCTELLQLIALHVLE